MDIPEVPGGGQGVPPPEKPVRGGSTRKPGGRRTQQTARNTGVVGGQPPSPSRSLNGRVNTQPPQGHGAARASRQGPQVLGTGSQPPKVPNEWLENFTKGMKQGKYGESRDTKTAIDLCRAVFNDEVKKGRFDIDRLRTDFFERIDGSKLSGPAKSNAKQVFNSVPKPEPLSESTPLPSWAHDYLQVFQDKMRVGQDANSQNTNTAIDQFYSALQREAGLLRRNESFSTNRLRTDFFARIDDRDISGPAKYSAKKTFDELFVNPQRSNRSKPFRLEPNQVQSTYQKLPVRRLQTSFEKEAGVGGAASVGYKKSTEPDAKIGVMIAANSGLPGGALGYNPRSIKKADLSRTTQEESVWANAVLTECGEDPVKQGDFHLMTIKDQWGLKDDRSTKTRQGVDYTTTTEASDYDGVHVVQGQLSELQRDNRGKLELLQGRHSRYPATLVFADSVNAGDAGTQGGTMQRTRNAKAATDYKFFRECIKTKLRSGLDAMAKEGVTHALVAQLSTGIYAGRWQNQIRGDFDTLLQEVLDEPVNGQVKRGQYFTEVIIPTLARS